MNIFDYTNVATFAVHNPQPTKPALLPEPKSLPTETVVGPVTVLLMKISVQERNLYPPFFVPEFEFFEQGKKSKDWAVDEITWSDSGGNHTERSSHIALCPFEPVWKLKARVFKTIESQFPPENLWVLPPFKLPGPGQCSPLSFTTNLQGVSLTFMGIAGPGKVIFSNGVPVQAKAAVRRGSGISVYSDRIEVESEQHHLALDCSGLGTDQCLDLRYRQLPGTKPAGELRMTCSSGTRQFYPLKVASNTEAIQVEAIVQSGHRVEFIVKPPTK